MELITLFFLCLPFTIILIATVLWMHSKKIPLPPSPPALPLLGHLHLLHNPPLHRTLQTLSNRYGAVLRLRFGSQRVLVLSSPSAVEDFLYKNDIVFANRPRTIFSDHFSFNYTIFSFSPYGEYWRTLRRVTTLKIFCRNSLEMSSRVRREVVGCLVRQILLRCSSSRSNCSGEIELSLSRFGFGVMLAMITGQVSGEGYLESEDCERLHSILKEIEAPSMIMNLGDFFPVLRWIDYKKVEKKMERLREKRDCFVGDLIDRYRRNKMVMDSNSDHVTVAGEKDEEKKKKKTTSIIEALLALQEEEPDHYSDDILKGIIVLILSVGPDTVASTIEWALSLLLNHPEALQKLVSEIKNNIQEGRLISESDLPNLHYLQCIIYETLRLYPVAPLLVPHMPSEDCYVGGFKVAQGTTVMANVWAIHRDPKVWEEPTRFKPERFEGVQGDRELWFKFIPFGVGRRGCPGAGLAFRLVGLALGSLLQCFEWDRVGEEPVEMSESDGLALLRAKPLVAKCYPRPTMLNVISQL